MHCSLTVVLFLVPSGLITGGATIALAVNRVGLPVSGVLFVINMTMLALGWAVLGRPLCAEHTGQQPAQPCIHRPVGVPAGRPHPDR